MFWVQSTLTSFGISYVICSFCVYLGASTNFQKAEDNVKALLKRQFTDKVSVLWIYILLKVFWVRLSLDCTCSNAYRILQFELKWVFSLKENFKGERIQNYIKMYWHLHGEMRKHEIVRFVRLSSGNETVQCYFASLLWFHRERKDFRFLLGLLL